MTLPEAMKSIGLDPDFYFRSLQDTVKRNRITIAENMLLDAKNAAKRLMVKHHPDKGGDHAKFVKVGQCLDVIEKETEKFLEKLRERIKEDEEKRASQPFITIG